MVPELSSGSDCETHQPVKDRRGTAVRADQQRAGRAEFRAGSPTGFGAPDGLLCRGDVVAIKQPDGPVIGAFQAGEVRGYQMTQACWARSVSGSASGLRPMRTSSGTTSRVQVRNARRCPALLQDTGALVPQEDAGALGPQETAAAGPSWPTAAMSPGSAPARDQPKAVNSWLPHLGAGAWRVPTACCVAGDGLRPPTSDLEEPVNARCAGKLWRQAHVVLVPVSVLRVPGRTGDRPAIPEVGRQLLEVVA